MVSGGCDPPNTRWSLRGVIRLTCSHCRAVFCCSQLTPKYDLFLHLCDEGGDEGSSGSSGSSRPKYIEGVFTSLEAELKKVCDWLKAVGGRGGRGTEHRGRGREGLMWGAGMLFLSSPSPFPFSPFSTLTFPCSHTLSTDLKNTNIVIFFRNHQNIFCNF